MIVKNQNKQIISKFKTLSKKETEQIIGGATQSHFSIEKLCEFTNLCNKSLEK